MGQRILGAVLPGEGGIARLGTPPRLMDGPGRERIAVMQMRGEIEAPFEPVNDADELPWDPQGLSNGLIAAPEFVQASHIECNLAAAVGPRRAGVEEGLILLLQACEVRRIDRPGRTASRCGGGRRRRQRG